MESIITNIESSYNVNNYTDEELYDILDLDNPNDRVLEAKIVQMINKYSSIGGESGEKLSKFFIDIYERFFYNSDDEDNRMENDYDIEESQIPPSNTYEGGYLDKLKNMFVADGKVNLREGLANQEDWVKGPSTDFIGNPIITPDADTGFIKADEPDDSKYIKAQNKQTETINISGTTNIMGNGSVSTTEDKQSKSIIVNQLEYRKDYLNPLLKQTVKRIISIDSQYRDTTFYPYSTSFTFNLSEPLKDVVAIRMYSMQIPYSWYTINNNYGGNFFYLKGNTAGIDNGSFDYKIDVKSGNYLPAILANSINESIATLKLANTDVSFGNTSISYDSSPNKATIFIDIKNNFNESDYAVNFDETSGLNRYPLSTDISGNFLKYKIDGNASISNYLGFNNLSYSGNSISTVNNFSVNNYTYSLGLTIDTKVDDETVSKYSLSVENNYFTIYQYIGNSYSEAILNNNVLFNTRITLDLSDNTITNSVTRNTIVNQINKKLGLNANLINSSLRRIDITNSNMQDNGLSTFKMDINWNKHAIPTANILNTKTAIVFPDEISGTGNRIWTIGEGATPANTCFYFPYKIMEVNEIYGETPINQTNYIINSSPTFKFVCTKPNYIGDKNDYTVTLNNSLATGYTLDEYLSAINTAIGITNENSNNNSNINGIFNMNNTKMLDDISTQNKVSLFADIAKSFTNIDGFIMDITASLLNTLYNFNNTYNPNISDFSVIDVSNNYILIGEIPQQNSYSFSGSILKIKPKYPLGGSPTGVYDFGTWNVIGTIGSSNLDNFTTSMQNIIRTFSDDGGTYPLSNSTFTYERLPGVTRIRFTLNLQINKVLSEKDFKVEFIGNTWKDNLTLKIIDDGDFYNLSSFAVTGQPYSQIFADSTLSGYAYYVNVPQTITIKAISNGVVADDNSNDIVLNIPVPTITLNNGSNNYTIQQLFALLNQQLTDNSYTKGSLFSLMEYNGKKYVKLRLNINRLYTTDDYKLVFYDPFSFATCISGQNIATNVKWDSTLGWILGFRQQTEYYLSSANTTGTTGRPNEKTLTGDTGVIISLYNYFLLVLDDYTQSHLNDGLITISKSYNEIPVFNSVVSNTFQCVDNGNTVAFTGTGTQVSNNKYTQKQIYAENQKYLSKKLKTSDYTAGPFANDVFALLPMKVTGLPNGATNVEFGGTLQNQERLYFGPVNIKRLSIKLLTDKGDVVDLNGQDWSFSFICESLYQVKTVQNGGSSGAKS